MPALILDIETAGEKLESFDQQTIDLIKEKNEDKDDNEIAQMLGLSPYTGKVVAIGTLDSDSDRGAVYYLDSNEVVNEETPSGIVYRSFKDEKELIKKFWELASSYSTFVTFNGRGFDIPFLMVRSAIHKVKPTKDLLRGRYLYQQSPGAGHIDLYDQLTFYNSFRYASGGSLHMACQAFGIESPKGGEVSGSMVTEMYHRGKFKEIAEYNGRDLWATRSLYNIYKEYLAI